MDNSGPGTWNDYHDNNLLELNVPNSYLLQ